MKNNKNTSNDQNADAIWGITVKCRKTDLIDYKKLIVYWFLDPKITSDHNWGEYNENNIDNNNL